MISKQQTLIKILVLVLCSSSRSAAIHTKQTASQFKVSAAEKPRQHADSKQTLQRREKKIHTDGDNDRRRERR